MVASRTVDAKWTFQHERTLASAEVMYITGALKAGDSLLQGIDYPVEEISAQTASGEGTSNVAKGECFCGQAQFELPLPLQPLLSTICYCRDCQEWNMSGGVPMVLYPLEKKAGADKFDIPIRVTSGNSMINYVQRSPPLRRYFTTCCGTRLFFTHCDAHIQMWGLFPPLFPTCDFPTPTIELHVRESRVHDLKVVAYSDLPIEFGGSGKQMGGGLLNLGREKEEGGNPDAKAKQENE